MALAAKCRRATMAAAAQHQYPDWSGADALGQAVDGPEDSELPDVMSSLVDCPAPVLDRRLDRLESGLVWRSRDWGGGGGGGHKTGGGGGYEGGVGLDARCEGVFF